MDTAHCSVSVTNYPEGVLSTRVIEVGRIPVCYAVTGHGDPLLLIHGFAGSWRWWRRNIPQLREHFTLYLIDLPGFGLMRPYWREFSLEKAPVWIQTLLRALQLERPSIIGHSMGGAIALAFAAKNPEHVDRLVLAAPAVHLPGNTIRGNVLPLLASACRLQPHFYPTLLHDTLRAGPVTLLRTARDLVTMRTAAECDQVKAPALLIWGSHDHLVPVKFAHTLQSAMPGSRLEIVAGAGHVVMFDRPSAFNNLVLQFLSAQALRQ